MTDVPNTSPPDPGWGEVSRNDSGQATQSTRSSINSIEPDSALSRRALLATGLAVSGAIAAGAVGFALTTPRRAKVPDPVPPADVIAAIGREQDLVDRYDGLIAVLPAPQPRLSVIRAEHRQHRDALASLLPARAAATISATETPSASPSSSATETPVDPAAASAALVEAERSGAAAARAACLSGNGTAAVLLACIAASEASHLAVLT